MKGFTKVLAVILLSFGLFFSNSLIAAPKVSAQDNLICQVFPFLSTVTGFGISSICGSTVDSGTAISGVRNLITFAVNLIFIGIIIVSVFIIIRAAFKYIRSEGDESKIQEAQKAIKSVFVGIAALFVGIIGLIIVLAFFNATNVGTEGCADNEAIDPLLGNEGCEPTE